MAPLEEEEHSEYMIQGVIVRSTSNRKISAPVTLVHGLKIDALPGLIDSGADSKFVDESIVDMTKAERLQKPIPVKNVDGTNNQAGSIHYRVKVQYTIGEKKFQDYFYVTNLGDQLMILGIDWLEKENPVINWSLKTVEFNLEKTRRWPGRAIRQILVNEQDPMEVMIRFMINSDSMQDAAHTDWVLKDEHYDSEENVLTPRDFSESGKEGIEDEERRNEIDTLVDESNLSLWSRSLWLRAKTSAAQHFAHLEQEKTKQEKAVLPKEYMQWASVFDKTKSERIPEHKPWDHAIVLKPDFEPKRHPNYPMTEEENQKLSDWLTDQTRKGYIRPSTSPMASPFFYVAKKEKGELRPCQDYHYLNSGTVKNAYPRMHILYHWSQIYCRRFEGQSFS